MKKKKNPIKLFLQLLVAAVFLLFTLSILIGNLMNYNQARDRVTEMERRNHLQSLTNAAIQARNELHTDSELREQYILETARESLGLVLPNEIVFYDIGR